MDTKDFLGSGKLVFDFPPAIKLTPFSKNSDGTFFQRKKYILVPFFIGCASFEGISDGRVGIFEYFFIVSSSNVIYNIILNFKYYERQSFFIHFFLNYQFSLCLSEIFFYQ